MQILKDPEWLTAIGTLLAVVVALFISLLDKVLAWINRPQIVFGKRFDVVEKYEAYNMLRYFRFRVINKGRTVAKNCQIRILSATPVNKKPKFPLIEQDKLKWSSAPMDNRYATYREKLDIPPNNGWEFCDLFRIESNSLIDLKFQSLGTDRKVPINDEYILIIEISGENIKPKRAKIRTFLPENGFWFINLDWVAK